MFSNLLKKMSLQAHAHGKIKAKAKDIREDLVNVGLIRHLTDRASISRQQVTKRMTETNRVVAYAERTTNRSSRTRRRIF